MAKSMTGFARVQIETDLHLVAIELRSVNHRYLDIQFRMPRNLYTLEERLKACLSKYVARGRVEVYIHLETSGSQPVSVHIDRGALIATLAELKELSGQYAIAGPITWDTLLKVPGLWTEGMEQTCNEETLNFILTAFENAASKLAEAREREGNGLARDLSARLDRLDQLMLAIVQRSRLAPEIAFRKWKERLQALVQDLPLDENRVIQEAAILADKMSVEEEISRLQLHIQHFRELLATGAPIGRKLDFLVQEMNREFNTLGAKSSDSPLSQSVVEAKAVVEQCREQIQNIE